MITLIAIFIGSCLAAWLGTRAMRRAAHRLAILSAPGLIVPQHRHSTALLGGVGLLAGLSAGVTLVWILGSIEEYPFSFVAMASPFTVLGLADDILVFRPLSKLSLQSVLALSAAATFSGRLTGIQILDIVLAAIWLLVLVNAYNVTDVCDGLLGAICLAAGAAWALMTDVATVFGLILAAAVLGFLPFNLPRASIFLGDAGSHLLGFCAAFLGLEAAATLDAGALILPTLVLWSGVPLFELALVSLARISHGLPFWRGSPDHFALRLQSIGWTALQVDLVAGAVMAASVGAGWLLLRVSAPWVALIVASAMGIGVLATVALWRIPVSRGSG